MRQFIESTVQILRSHPNAADDEVLKLVIASGIDEPMAMQLVTLLPLAYGRVMLSDTVAAFPDAFICVGEDGRGDRKGSLDALPLWREAIKFARQDQEPFFDIAGRSCEVRAANTALHEGSKLENLVWGPPVFIWPVDVFGSSDDIRQTPRWWWQLWNAPAEHSLTPGQLTIARCVMVLAILIAVLAIGVLVYYAIEL